MDRSRLTAETALESHPVEPVIPGVPRKTIGQAVTQIILADVSMSLDNVLAVAGAAQPHVEAMIFGLALSRCSRPPCQSPLDEEARACPTDGVAHFRSHTIGGSDRPSSPRDGGLRRCAPEPQLSLRKNFFSRGLPSQPGLPRGFSSRSTGRAL